MALPIFYLVRHGETAWSLSGQHTGLSDIPLTPNGEKHAAALAGRLHGLNLKAVFTSPLQRAAKTCVLAGFGSVMQIDPDLVEWNYGEYDGKTSAEIRAGRPDWSLFRDGCPGGETIDQVVVRADRFVQKIRATQGDCLVFTSGHISRVLCVRWLGLPGNLGRHFMNGTASVSMLGYEHALTEPVVRLWNESSRG